MNAKLSFGLRVCGLILCLSLPSHGQLKELYQFNSLSTIAPRDRKKFDSLTNQIKNAPDDSVKVDQLTALADFFQPSWNDSILITSQNAQALAELISYKRGLYYALDKQAGYFGTQGKVQLERSLELFVKCAAIAEGLHWPNGIHRAYSSILNIYFYRGDFPAAMRLSTQGLLLAEKENDPEKIATYKNLLGFIHLRQGNTIESKKYYEQYLQGAMAIHDSSRIMDAQIGLGEVLLAESKPTQALPVLMSPMHYFTQRLVRSGQSGVKTEKVPYSTFAVAKAYRDLGNYREALRLCLQGFRYSDSIAYNEYDLANYYLITGSVYEKLNRQPEAIEVYREGLKLSLRIQHAEDIRDGYASLSRIFSVQEKFDSAYRYEKLYSAMKDSIVNVRTRSEIQRINAEYDLAKKDQEIIQQRELLEEEIKRQSLIRNSLIIGTVFMAIISWLIYNHYRLKVKHRHEQQLTGQRAELLGNFLNAQTAERNSLAREIHDQVGTILSAAKLKLSGLEEESESEIKQELQSTLAMMDHATESLRNISHNLVPASLARLGLIVALKHFFDQLGRVSSIKIIFSAYHFTERLSETLETNLYPVVLELANNAIRHAQAKNLNIQIIRHPERINITVEDDGQGFDFKVKSTKTPGIGLAGIQSRIEVLKGVFHLDSAPGRGTVVMVDVPF